jgi:recombination protein RecT
MSQIQVIKKDISKIESNWIEQSGLDKSEFNKEASFAIQHLQKNEYLQGATRDSILKAVLNTAQVGLTLNPVSKQAYLVPRYNSQLRQLECVLDPSYVGLTKLLTDSGSVKYINCQLVYDGDEIEIDLATDKKIVKHIPYILTGKEKGFIKLVYSIATLHDGSFHVEYMSIKDVEEIRDRSEAYKAFKKGKTKTCIWETDKGEMTRKTCIKRHFKHLPKTNRVEKFEKAVDLSMQANGFNEPVSYNSIALAETLMRSANLSEEEKAKIENELYSIEYEHQARKLISHLKDNEQVLGVERMPHSMSDIQKLTKQKALEE